jgi:hypothetical protein
VLLCSILALTGTRSEAQRHTDARVIDTRFKDEEWSVQNHCFYAKKPADMMAPFVDQGASPTDPLSTSGLQYQGYRYSGGALQD